MVKSSDAQGEQPPEKEGEEVIVTGDAALIADAIRELADSFRGVASAIRSLSPVGGEEAEPSEDRYLDGTPKRK